MNQLSQVGYKAIRDFFSSRPGKVFLQEDLIDVCPKSITTRQVGLKTLADDGFLDCFSKQTVKPDSAGRYVNVTRKYYALAGTVLDCNTAIDEYKKRKGWSANVLEGLHCPECGCSRWEVKESRPAPGSIRRRRACQGCGARFTTRETIEGSDDPSSGLGKKLEALSQMQLLVAQARLALKQAGLTVELEEEDVN